ncbi:SDR family NAD(P)-dependent oxidoreductase [Hydrogenophaga electricum]|uniref:Short-chain dehydrogenase n=1 Tax=Hydrogenophaga electricum TaxID=1230953 RepID=A0ABQ6C8I1_9BURK|nr:SDR family NAD(P)-dependent oxidoreductase [Hydrogenophaga electricum]GLS16129.1 short-chain dehydrogenase [Hydrogenophaga electricum]
MKISQLFDVTGRRTLITGAASGIGRGIAEAMAANGARLTLIDQDGEALAAVAELLRQDGATVRTTVADVTDSVALRTAIDAMIAAEGGIDVVFANAGVSAGPGFLTGDGQRNPSASLENLSFDTFERAVAVNLGGTLRTIQLVTPALKRNPGGRIIVTTTVALHKTETMVSTLYVISKAAQGQLVRQAALELAAHNIQVNGIAPGPVITNIGGGRLQDPAARAPFERFIPMHRLATPQDLQGAALFLASPASSYVTGIQITVDGGGSLGTAD